MFSSYIEAKHKWSDSLKKYFSLCLKFLEWPSWNSFFGRVRQSLKDHLNQRSFIRSILENGFQATLRWKRMLGAFENNIFQLLKILELQPSSRSVRQNAQNCLNQNLVTESILENDFEVTLKSKTKVLSIWKEKFSGFLQIVGWRRWSHFLRKRDRAFKIIYI